MAFRIKYLFLYFTIVLSCIMTEISLSSFVDVLSSKKANSKKSRRRRRGKQKGPQEPKDDVDITAQDDAKTKLREEDPAQFFNPTQKKRESDGSHGNSFVEEVIHKLKQPTRLNLAPGGGRKKTAMKTEVWQTDQRTSMGRMEDYHPSRLNGRKNKHDIETGGPPKVPRNPTTSDTTSTLTISKDAYALMDYKSQKDYKQQTARELADDESPDEWELYESEEEDEVKSNKRLFAKAINDWQLDSDKVDTYTADDTPSKAKSNISDRVSKAVNAMKGGGAGKEETDSDEVDTYYTAVDTAHHISKRPDTPDPRQEPHDPELYPHVRGELDEYNDDDARDLMSYYELLNTVGIREVKKRPQVLEPAAAAGSRASRAGSASFTAEKTTPDPPLDPNWKSPLNNTNYAKRGLLLPHEAEAYLEESRRKISKTCWKTRKVAGEESTRTCQICFDDFGLSLFPVQTKKCLHEPVHCADCIESYLHAEVFGKMPDQIECMSCKANKVTPKVFLDHEDVKRLATKPTFSRYDNILARRAMGVSENFRWCSNPDCESGQDIVNPGRHHFFICDACGWRTCFKHQVPWDRGLHKGLTCEEYETTKDKTNDELCEDWKKKETKKCPKCKTDIQKN